MPERITNGSFDSGLNGWTVAGDGETFVDIQTGNAVAMNWDESAPGSVLSQTVNVTPNGTAVFSMNLGKTGLSPSTSPASLSLRIYYLDGSGNPVDLYNASGADAEGGVLSVRSPDALDQSITSAPFTIPDGVRQVVVEITDTTPSTVETELLFDNVSLDVTCFCAGTLIETADGPVPIERLRKGDMVLTATRGPQPVLWIGDREMAGSGKLAPVRIRAGALGNGLPRRDLLVSRQHRMLVRSPIVEAMFDCREALVPAIKLVGMPGIELHARMPRVRYLHLLLPRHEVIFAEGCATESLYLGKQAISTMTHEALDELSAIFPELIAELCEIETACLVPSPRDCKRLMTVHSSVAATVALQQPIKTASPR